MASATPVKGGGEAVIGNNSSSAVRVVARIRPNWDAKADPNATDCVSRTGSTTAMFKNGETYNFSSVLGPESTQADAYRVVCGWDEATQTSSFISETLKGFNATVIAYGQTGSGKTHTMMGADEDGIIPRLARDLFLGLENLSREHEDGSGALNVTVRVSFVEIYRERLRDLLNVMSTKTLRIREGDRKVVLEGVTEEFVTSHMELLEVMRRGNSARSVAATRMNEDSSRSHSVFTLKIEQQDVDLGTTLESKIQLVDLAGSEQVKRTGAAGDRLEEAKAINLSLSCLGNVVSALVERKPFVPYRDSKLTRLLQDSLGGTAKTCLIVTMSPSMLDEHESLSTLRFGQRAQKVQNQVVKNVKRTADELERLLAKAEEEIRTLRTGGVASSAALGTSANDLERIEEMQARIEDLELALEKSKHETEQLVSSKSELEKSKMQLDMEHSEALLREKHLQSDLDLVRQELEEALKQSLKEKETSMTGATAATTTTLLVDDVTHLTEKCVRLQMTIMEKEEEIEFLKEAKLDQVWVVLRETEQKLKTAMAEREKSESELTLARMQLKNRQEHLEALQFSYTRIQKQLLSEIDTLETKLNATTQELKNYKTVVAAATKHFQPGQSPNQQQTVGAVGTTRSVVVSRPVRIGTSSLRSSPAHATNGGPRTPPSIASLKESSSFFNTTTNNNNNNQSVLSNSFESFVEDMSAATSLSPLRKAVAQGREESGIALVKEEGEEELDESALSIVPYTANDHQRTSDMTKLKLLPERQFFFNETAKVIVKQEWKLDGRGGTELGFGSAVYPAAVALSFLLASRKYIDVKGKRVLELGTGTGVVGICASVCCDAAFVCATDGDEATVELAERNFRLNGIPDSKFKAKKLLWGPYADFSEWEDAKEPFEVVVASDIVALPYKEYLPLLLQTLVGLRERFKSSGSPGKFEILLAYTPRNAIEQEFLDGFGRRVSPSRGWKARVSFIQTL